MDSIRYSRREKEEKTEEDRKGKEFQGEFQEELQGERVTNCYDHYRKPQMGNGLVFLYKKMSRMVKLFDVRALFFNVFRCANAPL